MSAYVTLIALPIIARDSRTRDDDRSSWNATRRVTAAFSPRHDLSVTREKKYSFVTKREERGRKGEKQIKARTEKCRLLNEYLPWFTRDFSVPQNPRYATFHTTSRLRASLEQRVPTLSPDLRATRRNFRPFEPPFHFFFLFFLFLFTPQTLPRLLYSSFTISIERERKYRRILLVKVKGRRRISVGNSSTSITSENYIGSHAWTSLKSEGRKRLRLFLRESPCDASRRETSHPYHN